jgi:hypothetical protein
MKYTYNCEWKNMVEKKDLGDKRIDGKIILNWISKNSDSFRTGPN